MPRFLFALIFLAACGGSLDDVEDEAALSVVASIGPQSLTHGVLGPRRQLGYAFSGKSGDVIAPDVWPTAGPAFTPTLVLLGPKGPGGHRTLLAVGAPRGADPRHLAIDGFRLPKTGSYLAVVGLSRGDKAGRFSLRLWMQSSHLPRQESAQVDLTPAPAGDIDGHGPWTDAEIDATIAGVLQQGDLRTAISTLRSLLESAEVTDAQRPRVLSAAARLVGTPAQFGALDPHMQAFALWWLGTGDAPLFASEARAPPPTIDHTVARLVSAWPGAREDRPERRVQALVLGGALYGWQVDWTASVTDTGGRQVWIDFAREWFDSAGNWLGEQSAGASEPDDD